MPNTVISRTPTARARTLSAGAQSWSPGLQEVGPAPRRRRGRRATVNLPATSDASTSVKPKTRTQGTQLIRCDVCDQFDHIGGLCPTLRNLPVPTQPVPASPPSPSIPAAVPTTDGGNNPTPLIQSDIIDSVRVAIVKGVSLPDALKFFGVSEDLFWGHFN